MTPAEALPVIRDLGPALMLGGLLGLERQWRSGLIDLRANALVALGAAAFVKFAMLAPLEGEPMRVAAQVITGAGFLAAGLVLRDGLHIRGLNTGATLWCAAAVGMLAGAGQYALAGIVVVLAMIANFILRAIARQFEAMRGNSREPGSTD